MLANIGYTTLNISMIVYLIWFVPQIILNFRNKNTAGFSLLMQGILSTAYLCDLMYGFGLNMQWQYKMVTLAGLFSLSVQHWQFGLYGLRQASDKLTYLALNFWYVILICYAIFAITWSFHSRAFYDFAGMIANACWLSYMLPQICKNYQNQTTTGLSTHFVMIAIFLNLCDSTSAWTLNWDYPSKIGQAVALIGNSILLLQVFYYGKWKKSFPRLAFSR